MPHGNPLAYLMPGGSAPQNPMTAPEQPAGLDPLEKIKKLLALRAFQQQQQEMARGRAEAQGGGHLQAADAEQMQQRQILVDALARSAQKAQQPIQAAPAPQGQPGPQPFGPGMMREGGNPQQHQMDPRVIEALKRAGAL
jgi:hypothetical protein